MNREKLTKTFNRKRIFIPVIVGLGVAFYMIYSNFNSEAFYRLKWSTSVALWIFIAILMMIGRDLAYMIRLRVLCGKSLSWKSIFQSVLLWEFASSITPSVVGGSAVAIFILHKEKIKLGKSTAIIMVTALLDELFLIIMVPVLFLFFQQENLFILEGNTDKISKVIYLFWVSYSLILTYTSIILLSLFIFPKKFQRLINSIAHVKFLKRWKHRIERFSGDILIASEEMKGNNFWFWVKAFGATFFSWTSRFWVINFILLAAIVSSNESLLSIGEHFLVYARQLVMWVFMLISPTPGAVGVAEVVFSHYLKDFIPIGLAATLGLLWRLITYYVYIIAGAIILPQWLKRVFGS